MSGPYVVMKNRMDCELDRRECKPNDAKRIMKAMIEDTAFLANGDKFEFVWVDEPE